MEVEAPIITQMQRTQLERLLGSWELRARANVSGTETEVLRQNIAALKAALIAVDLVHGFQDQWKAERARIERVGEIVEGVRSSLDEFGTYRGPRPKRVDMTILANNLVSASRVLENAAE
jgi:hypothetical protein